MSLSIIGMPSSPGFLQILVLYPLYSIRSSSRTLSTIYGMKENNDFIIPPPPHRSLYSGLLIDPFEIRYLLVYIVKDVVDFSPNGSPIVNSFQLIVALLVSTRLFNFFFCLRSSLLLSICNQTLFHFGNIYSHTYQKKIIILVLFSVSK